MTTQSKSTTLQSVPFSSAPSSVSEEDVLTRMAVTFEIAEQALEEVEQLDADVVTTNPVAKKTALALSVVIPVYNERDTIREIVDRVRAVGLHQEIVIVDDFSIDGTRQILTELAEDEDIHIFFHGYNRGKGAALRTAFEHVQGDVVLVQDADLEYDPADYAKLLAPIEQDKADVVYGSRFLENAQGKKVSEGKKVSGTFCAKYPSGRSGKRFLTPFFHRLGNRLLTIASNLFTGQKLTDMETCYKVFRRVVLAGIEIEQNRFGFEPEITAKISHFGHHIHEVPIRYNSRSYDEGKKIGIRDAINALWCIVKYR